MCYKKRNIAEQELEVKSFRTFRDMKGRLTITTVAGSWWAIQSASNRVRHPGVRQLVMKASDRAAVHGVKPPIQDIVDKEAEEVESQRAKEEREKKRKEIEDIVDSQLKKTTLNVLSN